jgi:CPA2 family monovalent cation:H+ antiporter-2
VSVVRTLRGKDEDVRSATARLVEVLARDAAPEDAVPAEGPPPTHEPGWLPATEELRQVRIPEGAAAVGRTLAELDLRARTGATVVLILSDDGRRHSLPSGHVRLEAGQVVMLMGAEDADENAQALLTSPPRDPLPPRPSPAG